MSDTEQLEKYECDRCGAEVTETDTVCPRCGNDISEITGIDEAENNFENVAQKPISRYPALSTIASVYYALAWVTLVGSIVVGIIWAGNASDFSLPLLLEFIIVGVIGCITFLAVAEGIMVFIDIEYNTRRTAESLRKAD